jgi:hypothetical protein
MEVADQRLIASDRPMRRSRLQLGQGRVGFRSVTLIEASSSS